MKTLACLIAAGTLALSATAQTKIIEFADDTGESQVWTLRDDGTATGPDGVEASYTYDEATKTLCAEVLELGKVCVQGEAEIHEVGDSTRYVDSDGASGTATILALEE